MEEIAMKAKVSKGTLYNHFDSKDDLFLALIYSEAKRISGELPSLDLEESNPVSALRQMGLAILKAMEAPATVATLRLIVGSLGRFPHLGEEFLAHSLGPSVEQIAIYLNVHETAIGIPKQDQHATAKQFTRWCLAHAMERVLMLDRLQQSSEDCSVWVERMLYTTTVSQQVHGHG